MARVCSLILALLAAGCGFPAGGQEGAPPPASRAERIDRALAQAAGYLVGLQGDDGAWRSELKGPFKDGNSLTPLVVHALRQAGLAEQSRDRGAAYLAALAKADGTIDPGPYGLSYPVYTSSLTVLALADGAHARARDAWLAYLRSRQLTEDLGWRPEDRPYGGWGYCSVLPRRPPPGELGPPLLESNLSATAFALEALRAGGVPAADPAYRKALVFVQRCQNYHDEADPAFDDGGFFFIYDDAVRNKAGPAGQDRAGRERFRSYGSTTADGLRALLLCGSRPDEAHVGAARGWLERHFRPATHPGAYGPNRERDREAVYHYYAWSAARALRAAGTREAGGVRWAAALADALLDRQQADGSWVNDREQVREDDPLVATPLAVLALATCREALAGE